MIENKFNNKSLNINYIYCLFNLWNLKEDIQMKNY